jgi:small ligand-binding sensory domain FIST
MTEVSHEYSVAGHWTGGFEEAGLKSWAAGLRARLNAPQVSLGLVFMAPALFPHAADVLELLRVHARIPLLLGCSGQGLLAEADEFEADPGLVLGLYHLPGATLKACRFSQEQVEEANGPAYWHAETGLGPDDLNGWIVLADPFHMDCERWLRGWNEAYEGRPVFGGLASGPSGEPSTQIYLDGQVFEQGAVALAIGGQVQIDGVISQGCSPIGEAWTITRSDRHVIFQIGNRPAYQVLEEAFRTLSPEERRKAGSPLVGLAMNEYLEEFHRGDFLIRVLMAADPNSGAIAIGALPRVGQTIQFQRRDAASASEDLTHLLERKKSDLSGRRILGGVLCTCNGRGRSMFRQAGHDAQHVRQAFGPFGLAGFFCNGEIGPVGDRSYLHGFTASLAVFVAADAS